MTTGGVLFPKRNHMNYTADNCQYSAGHFLNPCLVQEKIRSTADLGKKGLPAGLRSRYWWGENTAGCPLRPTCKYMYIIYIYICSDIYIYIYIFFIFRFRLPLHVYTSVNMPFFIWTSGNFCQTQVGLFLVAMVFLLFAFATSISALNHHLVDFDGVHIWLRSLFQIVIGMFPVSNYDLFEDSLTRPKFWPKGCHYDLNRKKWLWWPSCRCSSFWSSFSSCLWAKKWHLVITWVKCSAQELVGGTAEPVLPWNVCRHESGTESDSFFFRNLLVFSAWWFFVADVCVQPVDQGRELPDWEGSMSLCSKWNGQNHGLQRPFGRSKQRLQMDRNITSQRSSGCLVSLFWGNCSGYDAPWQGTGSKQHKNYAVCNHETHGKFPIPAFLSFKVLFFDVAQPILHPSIPYDFWVKVQLSRCEKK